MLLLSSRVFIFKNRDVRWPDADCRIEARARFFTTEAWGVRFLAAWGRWRTVAEWSRGVFVEFRKGTFISLLEGLVGDLWRRVFRDGKRVIRKMGMKGKSSKPIEVE